MLHSWINLVTFRFNRIAFALPTQSIRQIIEMATLTTLSRASGEIIGVFHYDGQTMPVIDVCACLSMPKGILRQLAPIIIANIHGRPGGLLVDEIQAIISLPLGQIITPQEIFPSRMKAPAMLRGLVKVQNQMAMLLDLEGLQLLDQGARTEQACTGRAV